MIFRPRDTVDTGEFGSVLVKVEVITQFWFEALIVMTFGTSLRSSVYVAEFWTMDVGNVVSYEISTVALAGST